MKIGGASGRIGNIARTNRIVDEVFQKEVALHHQGGFPA